MRSARFVALSVLVCALLALAGCSSYQLEHEVRLAEETGDWDQAVLKYLELTRADPGSIEYRAGLLRAKIQASLAHFEVAKKYQEAGQLERALVELQEAVQLDPTNQYAQVELDKVREQLKAKRDQFDYATSLDTLKERNRGALAQPPVLDPRSNEPIDLDFPEAVSVMDIYRALGKAFGINVLFDPRLRDQEIAIELKQVTAQDALEILMRASGHFYKVVDSHSIIIAADTPQNRRAYEDLMIQTFFLSNAEVRDVMTMLRSLIDTRKLAANERLNAIVLRDTADRVKVAEKLIEVNDKARSEVVIDVELMQINSSKLRELGVSMDPYQIGFTLDGEQVEGGDGDGEARRRPAVGLRDPALRSRVHQLVELAGDGAELPGRFRQGQHRRPRARQAAAAHQRGREGQPGDRRQGADPGDQLQHLEHHRRQHRAAHLVPVHRRRHHHQHRAARPPQQRGDAQGHGRDLEHLRQRRAAADHRHPPHRHHHSVEGRRDQLPGRPHPHRRGHQRHRHPRTVRHPGHRPPVRSQVRPGATHRHRAHAHAAHHPPRRHHRRRPAADLGRHRDQLQLPRRQPAGRVRGAWTVRRRRPGAGRSGGGAGAPAPAARAAPPGLQQQEPSEEAEPEAQPPGGEEQQGKPQQPPRGFELVPSTGLPGRPSLQPPPPAEEPDNQSALDEPAAPEADSSRLSLDSVAAAFDPAEPPDDGVLYAAAAPRGAAGGVRLALEPSRPQVAVGDLFDVVLAVTAETAVSHLPSTLAYDPQLLELVDTEGGSFFGEGAEAQTLIDSSQIGRVVVGASRMGRTHGVAGHGKLLMLRFRALRPGEAEIRFEKKRALDAYLQVVGPLATSPAKITIAAAAAPPVVPERPREAIAPPEREAPGSEEP